MRTFLSFSLDLFPSRGSFFPSFCFSPSLLWGCGEISFLSLFCYIFPLSLWE